MHVMSVRKRARVIDDNETRRSGIDGIWLMRIQIVSSAVSLINGPWRAGELQLHT